MVRMGGCVGADLLKVQGLFARAAIAQVTEDLNLHVHLNGRKTEEIAQALRFNTEAFQRFLHAAASLGLIAKQGDIFLPNTSLPEYSEQPSLILFWMIRENIFDKLQTNKVNQESIGDCFPEKQEQQFLREAVELGLVLCDEIGRYATYPEHAHLLNPDSKDYIGPTIKHFEMIMRPMFEKSVIINALKEGCSQWHTVFKHGDSTPFNLYQDRPEFMEVFTRAMQQLNAKEDKRLVGSLAGLHHATSVLDVGGGSGSLAIQFASQFPNIRRATIYEVEDGIPLFQSILEEHPLYQQEKINYVPGSFLDDGVNGQLPGLEGKKFDLLILGWILHDWDNETCLKILRRCAKHLPSSGHIILVEGILPNDRLGPLTMLDMAMLLQTEGMERTWREYRDLLEEVGFTNVYKTESDTRRQAIIGNRK